MEEEWGLITKISSTYMSIKINSMEVIFNKRDIFIFESVNPRENKH